MDKSDKRILAKNKRATFDYDIQKLYEAGIILKGSEVKSAKTGRVKLKDSFVRIEGDEAWVINMSISRWSSSFLPNYDPKAKRKLLLSRQEIRTLENSQNVKKLSIIPIEMYEKNRRVKLSIGLGKPRRKYDKRKRIKEREMKREMKKRALDSKYF